MVYHLEVHAVIWCAPFLQYFTVMAILEGFKWKIDRTYEEFAELQRTVSV